MRVVFGSRDERLRAAIRAALDLTMSLPRLMAMALSPRGSLPWRRFERAVAHVDATLMAAVRARRPGAGPPAVVDELLAAGPPERELRDQLVTLLAAGHETTAGALAWALERLARHPAVQERLREDGDAYLDAVVKEVLRVRPVLSATPRKAAVPYTVGGWTVPAGIHVTPSPYLAHRRPERWPDPTAFRPERFLDGAPEPLTWLPFGGGTRRCAGAAFATMELKAVLATVAGGGHPAAGPAGRRADAPPGCHPDARARRTRRRGRRARRSHDRRSSAATTASPPSARSARRSSKPSCARRRRRAPPGRGRRRSSPLLVPRARAAPRRARPGGVVTRRLARAADDGYRNPLVPGLRATADAERLAGALTAAAERLEPPGPYEAVATEPDREQATWLAFLLALIGPDAPDAAGRGRRGAAALGGRRGARTSRAGTRAPIASYRQWAERAGSQAAGFLGEADWTPQRRFARVFERLALPGIGPRDPLRAARHARRRRPLPAARPTRSSSAWRTTPPRRRPSGCCSPATACCSSAARATSPRRPSCRSRRSTAAWRCGARPAPTSTSRRSSPAARARRARLAMSTACPSAAARRASDRARRRRAPVRRGAPRPRPPPGARLPRARRARAPPARRADVRPVGVDRLGPRDRRGSTSDTRTGPSWKPLPVLFTTPFALRGRRLGARAVARGGAGRRAARVRVRLPARGAPRRAARRACSPLLGLLLAGEFVLHFARGNSEGLLVALCLWAVERHLDGRRTQAFLLGVAGGLLRPGAVAVPARLRAVADVARAAPPLARARLRRAHAGAVVPAGVVGLGRSAARGRARARPQPRLGRVRRGPVPGDLPPGGGRADVPGPARGRARARRGRAAARPRAAGARRRSRRCSWSPWRR